MKSLHPGHWLATCVVLLYAWQISVAQTFISHDVSFSTLDLVDVASGDLDNDGDLDIVGITSKHPKIVWYENIDSAIVAKQRLVESDRNLLGFHLADVNHDGWLDILVAKPFDRAFSYYQNNQNKTFSLVTIGDQGTFPTVVHATDINGDGYLDIIYGGDNDPNVHDLRWFESDGNGSFYPSARRLDFDLAKPTAILSADADNDGDVDIFVTAERSSKFVWIENNSGALTQEHVIEDGLTPIAISLGDVDSDGDSDIFAITGGNGNIYMYENQNSGGIGQRTIPTGSVSGITDIDLGDMDRDGDLDIVYSANKTFSSNVWIENDGDGMFGVKHEFGINNPSDLVHVADLTNDGWVDILATSAREDRIIYYVNLRDHSFSEPIDVSYSNSLARSHAVADFDNDGDQDIVVASTNDNKISWFENLGDFQFSRPYILPSQGVFAESVKADDVDGDGDIDIIAAFSFASQIVWYENLSNGNFSNMKLIVELDDPMEEMILDDLDQDGITDILFATDDAVDDRSTIGWIRSLGGGNFGIAKTITTLIDRPESFECADINLDGHKDIISISYFTEELAWFPNNGFEEFNTRILLDHLGSDLLHVHATDIDNDGDEDLFISTNGDTDLSYLVNYGDSTFVSQSLSQSSAVAWDIKSGDIDLDGLPDIVSGSAEDNDIEWYKNRNGFFQLARKVAYNVDGMASLTLIDMDNDLDLDVVSTSIFDGNITVYENKLVDCISAFDTTTLSICSNEGIEINGVWIVQPGYYHQLFIDSTNFCDSLATTHLIVKPSYFEHIVDTIDFGEVYVLPTGEEISEPGIYSLTLQSREGCDSTLRFDIFVNNNTGTTSVGMNEVSFRVYPNPAINTITVSTDELVAGPKIVKIFNTDGSFALSKAMLTNQVTLDISDCQKGPLLLLIENKEQEFTFLQKILRIQ